MDLLFGQQKAEDTNTRKLPFVVPFHNTVSQISNILKRHWHMILNDDNLKEIWMDPQFLALKRHANTKEILVRSKF